MTDEELAKQIIDNINYQEILNNINTWDTQMTETERKELSEAGALL